MENTYKFRVSFDVVVEAFDADEAFDRLQDEFGPGERLGITVDNCDYKPRKR